MTKYQALAVQLKSLGFPLLAQALLDSPTQFPNPTQLMENWNDWTSTRKFPTLQLDHGDSAKG